MSDLSERVISPSLQGCEVGDRAKQAPGGWGVFLRRWRTRRALGELSDSQLRDIGLTREQAQAEAQMPFWRLWR
ncbi:DUF1127 domain-containing protein [Pseudomonas sp. Marseille-Q8238]